MAGYQNSFLKNSFLLIYEGAKSNDKYLSFRFDSIIDMKATVGLGLYFEGTAKIMSYSLGQSDPVKLTLRKNLKLNEINTVNGKDTPVEQFPFDGSRRLEVESEQLKSEQFSETSIYEWGEIINSARVDRASLRIFGKIAKSEFKKGTNENPRLGLKNNQATISDNDFSGFVQLLELKGSYPTTALVHSFRGQNVADLVLVGDTLITNESSEFLLTR
ncbi:hypothetical protein GCM10007978_32840 [Shewanella hanedai]|jgi:hypothetical protein|uniref:Uncharacterized protein n=1 Tax=Shewanella hanedai TaxID=25 RepID=A0A553JK55_SHEHA|nr:hypothetical protein [Shewanella hanedai]TRY12826.1 hypothetical protein FN961_18575 [Shewanella hanedai]GGI92742.1 hypothetical protein GCM10007978_32840 [Shewanella hanedai]